MRVNAVVLAAGQGTRMGTTTPKPFLPLAGRPLILHTLNRFLQTQSVRKVILVAAATEVSRCQEAVQSDPRLKDLEVVLAIGGPRRQDSVDNSLHRLDPDCEIVVIHDGVRPFVSPGIIDRCVELAVKNGAVAVGVPVRETIKVVSGGRILQTPPRESLWEMQTPQVFRKEIIREAYQRARQEGIEATDDAMLVERLGKEVILVEGQRSNLKITEPEDLWLAEILIREGKGT